MSKFKIGDRVRKKNKEKFTNEELIATITEIENNKIWLKETGTYIFTKDAILMNDTYPNLPHKHAELIHAWADGAIIQYKINNTWKDFNNNNVQWGNVENYILRIKPDISPEQEEINKIEEEMRNLADRLNKLKGEE